MCRKHSFRSVSTPAARKKEEGLKNTRAARLGVCVPPELLADLPESAGMWHESAEEVERALAWGERKQMLIAWVREMLRRRLSESERRCVELYFFEGLSYREAGARAGTTASSVHRGLQRALEKLREAAETDREIAVLIRKRR